MTTRAVEIIDMINEHRTELNEFKLPSFKKIKKMMKKFKKSKPKKTKQAFDAKAAKKKQGKSFWKKFFEGMCEASDEEKMKALAKYLKVDPEEVENNGYAFEADGEEWEVLTDDEADEKLKDYIAESLWAFNTSFLLWHITEDSVIENLGLESTYYDEDTEEEIEIEDKEEIIYLNTGMNLEELVKSYQEKYESGNQDLMNLLPDFDEFVSEAERADGRGHFLNSYDGEEVEMGDFFGYRVN